MRPLVLYHGNCYDGLTAAWVASKALDNPECLPQVYGGPLPTIEQVKGREVYVLDFSFERVWMAAFAIAAKTFLVLDHHKTAEAACAGLPFCHFDMNRSGCRMAWDYWFPEMSPPQWLLHVEDRDLWRFALPNTRFLHAAIAARPMTLEAWDEIAATDYNLLVAEGMAISRYIAMWIEKAAAQARLVDFVAPDRMVHRAVVVNVPYQNASEMGSYLLGQFPEAVFSIGYFQRADGLWQYSLRSRPSFDVSAIATQYGGGGHAQAAGFESSKLVVL